MFRIRWIISALIIFVLFAYWLTAPGHVSDSYFSGLKGDTDRGALVFAVSGCASCHAPPAASGDDKLRLAGGIEFETQFGTFIAPNISPDSQGIGDWSAIDLANAMVHGTSPDGWHYYPAFPYTSYQNMTAQDILDLCTYLQTLPSDDTPSRAHDVEFPFNMRRALGGWKLLFSGDGVAKPAVSADDEIQRGYDLVAGPGHCAQCHTPRNLLGGFKANQWLAGGPNPDGPGTIPSLRPDDLGWTQDELVDYFKTGFTPDFDVVGGSMVDVQENLAQLPDADLRAIADYLVNLPSAPVSESSGY